MAFAYLILLHPTRFSMVRPQGHFRHFSVWISWRNAASFRFSALVGCGQDASPCHGFLHAVHVSARHKWQKALALALLLLLLPLPSPSPSP